MAWALILEVGFYIKRGSVMRYNVLSLLFLSENECQLAILLLIDRLLYRKAGEGVPGFQKAEGSKVPGRSEGP